MCYTSPQFGTTSARTLAPDALLDIAAHCRRLCLASAARVLAGVSCCDKPSAVISSARLDLIPMTPAFLEAALRGESRAAEAILGLAVPAAWYENRGLMEMRLAQLRQDPSLQPWLLRAIGLRGQGAPGSACMVGHIGFHTGAEPRVPARTGAGRRGAGLFGLPALSPARLRPGGGAGADGLGRPGAWRVALRGEHQPPERAVPGAGQELRLPAHRLADGRGGWSGGHLRACGCPDGSRARGCPLSRGNRRACLARFACSVL